MKKIYTVALFCLLLIVSSCKSNTENNASKETETNNVVEATSVEEATNVDDQMVISTPTGEKIGGFTLDPLTIYAGGNKYTSKNKPDKHKFYTNGSMVYEVKFKSEGFKLRDKNSELLWKIKIYPDKIKISDNEENENAFEIRRYDDKIKIKRNEEELYAIQLGSSSVTVNDEILYQLSSNQDNYVYAILAIKEIPEDQKMFILAELSTQL
ncbi:hypothetical protein ATE84_5122 [Aquimarina sp. MAR_2010_214]|uniref:hypothetical protein n=1 Tax=Aquimarina sp. MAR_2010_214 TaxID=1250026 RepID=UPI000C7003F7|nr:hypothetical protein [Aquimarina sp. MAR_2010_214]PKV52989.1 hypothetical protein ATE84_5122 [Aquimarina sp. MAR_2010_214]